MRNRYRIPHHTIVCLQKPVHQETTIFYFTLDCIVCPSHRTRSIQNDKCDRTMSRSSRSAVVFSPPQRHPPLFWQRPSSPTAPIITLQIVETDTHSTMSPIRACSLGLFYTLPQACLHCWSRTRRSANGHVVDAGRSDHTYHCARTPTPPMEDTEC